MMVVVFMIMIMLLRWWWWWWWLWLCWWWWLSWQRSSWPSCSITLRQGTRVDLLVTPLLHVVSRILMRITVGRSYTWIKVKFPFWKNPLAHSFQLSTPPPFTPLKGSGDNMRAGSQEDCSVLLHCCRNLYLIIIAVVYSFHKPCYPFLLLS